ncbi:TadE/TadG family type IV pilus assembly protein [Paenibacillus montanisoli]|uniref:TadE-like domain-containing protein n=1 Tax=Paenibacillus montanisoli TaxID=2081970 RepID=A0A328UAI4_9BACL|nr:TadE family protein [Paenibacillus montanisoli]RAP77066.1 hypothetical protein DL346_00740 [Paenibacillus montanisoli]
MKRRIPLAGRTGRRGGEAGSIVVEAALILPIVLMVILFFICLIRLNAVQMALHSAVSQSVRQAAANIHPIDLALKHAASRNSTANPTLDQAPLSTVTALKQLPGIDLVARQLEEWLPSPAGPLLSAALQGNWMPVVDAAATEAGRHIVEPLLRHEADEAVLNPGQLRLSKLSLPDLKGRSEVMLRIEAEYEFKLAFPFTRKTILLKESAAERVWISDSVPARKDDQSEQDDKAPIQIVQLEPSPINPGHRARVVVRTNPGRKLSIKVMYKSGQSVAKHLGETVTDSEGYAEWTWLVSGNTTPGIWELIVTSSDGASRSARHFVVEKRTRD